MASATAELEAAIAALPAKKQRLRESFDRLVASAPIPIPFTWDEINAHFSSIQSSIAVRFLKVQSLQAAAPTTNDPVEHRGKGNEDRKPYPEYHVKDNDEEGERASGGSDLNADEEGEQGRAEEVIDASADQVDDDGEAIEASPGLELGEEEKEEEDEAKEAATEPSEEEKVPTCPIPDSAGGAEEAVRPDLVAPCVNMDPPMLADMFYGCGMRFSRARSQFLSVLLGVAEPHALVVGAVRDFLVRTEPKNNTHWDNCGSLLLCARELTDEPSASTMEQANRLAEDWKEMIGKPESCRDLGRLAVWGLLRFLILFNITLEFDAYEIIHHLGNLPKKKRRNCIELCNHLGLTHRMTDSVNHLIQNGQQLDAIKLACVLNLTDKYPPLSIMNEYVDKAKKTAQEILTMESVSLESLNQAMTKQVNALILSWRAVDECKIEPIHRNSIKAEITRLLHEYAHKRQSLSDVSSPALNEEQQEQCQRELQMLEEELREKQQTWSGQKSGEKGQNKKRKRNHYLQKMHHRFHKQPRLSHAGSFAHYAYNAGSGIGDRRGQRFSGIRGEPTPYRGPYCRSQPRPAYRPE